MNIMLVSVSSRTREWFADGTWCHSPGCADSVSCRISHASDAWRVTGLAIGLLRCMRQMVGWLGNCILACDVFYCSLIVRTSWIGFLVRPSEKSGIT